MNLFLLMFFSIYGGVNGYFYFKARRAFDLSGASSWLLLAFLLFMVTTPVAVRILEDLGHEATARVTAYPGFLWMGFLFLFFTLALLGDCYNAGAALFGHLTGRSWVHLLLSHRLGFLLPLFLAGAFSCYGFGEALRIRTEHIVIPSGKIPHDMQRLRIVQLSDVHLGLIVREGRLRRMLAATAAAEPDLIVITGDLLDGQPDGYPAMAALFRDLKPPLGKFAVTGNHEFYVGIQRMKEFAAMAGLTLLRGDVATCGSIITVAGVDDPAGKRTGTGHDVRERDLLVPLPRERFTLLLKHRPTLDSEAFGLFDLQLSGHVHKGQIFPFNLITRLAYPVRTGLSKGGGGSLLYVSRGTGTWGPPIRFLAPPEITVIDLVPR
jgi:predicted MPP superfamily phosphohydrolase